MTSVPATFDFKSTVSDKRLRGLWRMTRGYRLIYIGALFFIGVGAADEHADLRAAGLSD